MGGVVKRYIKIDVIVLKRDNSAAMYGLGTDNAHSTTLNIDVTPITLT